MYGRTVHVKVCHQGIPEVSVHTGAVPAAAGVVAAHPLTAGGHSDHSMCLDCCTQLQG